MKKFIKFLGYFFLYFLTVGVLAVAELDTLGMAVFFGVPTLLILYYIYRKIHRLVSNSIKELKTPEVEIRGNLTILICMIGIGLIFVDPLIGGIFGFVWTLFVIFHFFFTSGNVRYSIITAMLFEFVSFAILILMEEPFAGVIFVTVFLLGKPALILLFIAMGLGTANEHAVKAVKEKKIIV